MSIFKVYPVFFVCFVTNTPGLISDFDHTWTRIIFLALAPCQYGPIDPGSILSQYLFSSLCAGVCVDVCLCVCGERAACQLCNLFSNLRSGLYTHSTICSDKTGLTLRLLPNTCTYCNSLWRPAIDQSQTGLVRSRGFLTVCLHGLLSLNMF